MSLYNMIFGRNPVSSVLLAMIGQTEGSVGRFRDCYVTELDGRPVIAIYTRNGGGNRECWHADDPKWGNEGCKHRAYEEESDEYVEMPEAEGLALGYKPVNIYSGNKRGFKTGKRIMETRYECLAPHSAECSCPGCTIEYRLPNAPGYIHDEDDEFDCTYCTAYFEVPEEWRDLLAGLVREGRPSADWSDFLDALKDPPAEARTRPQQLALSLIAQLGGADGGPE